MNPGHIKAPGFNSEERGATWWGLYLAACRLLQD